MIAKIKDLCFGLMCAFALYATAHAESDKPQSFANHCMVEDPDIAARYIGECRDNHANGYGFASGRDEYRGDFKNGLTHGFGIYSWGAQSEFVTEEYRGWHYKGRKVGFGVSSISSTQLNHPSFDLFQNKGALKYGRYFISGLHRSTEILQFCESEDSCLDEFKTLNFDEVDDLVTDKKRTTKLSDLRRLTALAVQRQSKSTPKVTECIVEELITNSIVQKDDAALVDAVRVSKYQRSLQSKRLVTQVLMYCIE